MMFCNPSIASNWLPLVTRKWPPASRSLLNTWQLWRFSLAIARRRIGCRGLEKTKAILKHLVVSYLILTRGGGVKINIDPPQIGKLFLKLMKQCVKRISLNCKLKILADLESDSKRLFEHSLHIEGISNSNFFLSSMLNSSNIIYTHRYSYLISILLILIKQ